jgi:ABC-type uncharacterized transport system fused permease/ATPase subunit
MNLRMNAESIAFYDSSASELKSLNFTFKKLLGIQLKINFNEQVFALLSI